MNKVLYKFENFPLSVCTQEGPLTDSEVLIEATIEEDETGLISFLPYVDPKLIYISQHNSSIGKTWQDHNHQFAKHVLDKEKEYVVDIGGGTGNIYKNYVALNPNVQWKIIDLNPCDTENSNLSIVKGLYDPKYIKENDTVITSHFIEHLANIREFLTDLRSKNPKYHIFSLPNFKEYSKSNYSATIMFEHPHYLTEEYLDYILSSTGWEVVDKQYYKKHSIFFTTRPSEAKELDVKLNCSLEIMSFLNYIKSKAESLKDKKFYVFGAHFTYYYLLNMGIKEEQIIAVVDNDPLKQNKRMYGTNTKVISFQEVPEGSDVLVEMGPYNEEIKSSIKNVNFI